MAAKKNGDIHVLTGIAAGKTTSALGVAMREAGWGRRAIIIQFLKGRKEIGEYKIAERLSPEYEIYQFGKPDFIDLNKPSKEDIKMAEEGLKFANQMIKEKPSLLVLDEINYAMAYKLLRVKDVIDLLNKVPKETAVYLTGRDCPREIMDVADYVTELVDLKHPSRISAHKGIEY